MAVVLADFKMLAAAPHAEAARVLRAALARLPSGYRAPGEAEAEVEARLGDDDWLGYAALDGDRLVGWIGALRTYDHRWSWRPTGSDTASVQPCSPDWKTAPGEKAR